MLKKIVSFLTKSDLLLCPCCNKYSKQFLEFGTIPRQNAQCPNCKALERHRLLLLYLRNETNLFKGGISLLHFAPEQALHNIFSSLDIEYVTTDLNSSLAQYQADIVKLPFRSNSFDLIICFHVLEHVKDDNKAMRELYRVLSKGGIALIQSTVFRDLPQTYEDLRITTPKGRLKAFGQDDHVRKYGPDLIDRLSAAGFRVTEDIYPQRLGEKKIKKYALTPWEAIYVCKK